MQHRGDSCTAPRELILQQRSSSASPSSLGEFHQLEWWEMLELATQETETSPVPSQGMLSHLLEDGWVLVGCSTGRFMHRPTCKWFIFFVEVMELDPPGSMASLGDWFTRWLCSPWIPCLVFRCLTPEQLLAFPSEPWKRQNINRKSHP